MIKMIKGHMETYRYSIKLNRVLNITIMVTEQKFQLSSEIKVQAVEIANTRHCYRISTYCDEYGHC
jgi:hypothetical protein